MKRWIAGLKFLFLKISFMFPSQTYRKFILKIMGTKLGINVAFYGGAEVRNPKGLTIGYGTSIGHDAILDARSGLDIGNNVNLSSQVMIWTLQHDHRCPHFGCSGGKVTICDYAWLGPRTIILPGVTIGEGAVVAAGAVVTKSIEAYTVVAGIPAIKKSDRPRDMQYIPGKSPALFY